MFRRRRQQISEERGDEVYQVRERLLDIGDDYWIETDRGRRAFKFDNKVPRIRDTFAIRTPDGTEVARLQERPVRFRDTYKIERPGKPARHPDAGVVADRRRHLLCRSGSRRTSTSSTSGSPRTSSRRSTHSTPACEAAPEPADINLENYGMPIPEA